MYIVPKLYKLCVLSEALVISSIQNYFYNYIGSMLDNKSSELEAQKVVSITAEFFMALIAALIIEIIRIILGL